MLHQGYIFIPCANRVLADHGKYILDAKEKLIANKNFPSKLEFTKHGQSYLPAGQQNLQSATNHPPIPLPDLPLSSQISNFLFYLDACKKTASTHGPSFGVIYIFTPKFSLVMIIFPNGHFKRCFTQILVSSAGDAFNLKYFFQGCIL